MSHRIIGSCSLCGGQVGVPTIWHGVHPPEPQCLKCHAIAKQPGPVIEMQPPKRQVGSVVGRMGPSPGHTAQDLDDLSRLF